MKTENKYYSRILLVSALVLLVLATTQSPVLKGIHNYLGDVNLNYEQSVSGLGITYPSQPLGSRFGAQNDLEWESKSYCKDYSPESIVFLEEVRLQHEAPTIWYLYDGILHEELPPQDQWDYMDGK